MNMLFWVWYEKYKESREVDEEPYFDESIDSLIPSPIYFFIGILCGLGIIGISWLIFKLFIAV